MLLILDRETLDRERAKTIAEKARSWGVIVKPVENGDLLIPGGLEDAMSRQAQANPRAEARIILAESELKVADLMQEASMTDQDNLLAMNMTDACIKEQGALMIVPSSVSTSLDPASLAAPNFRPLDKT